MSTPAAGPVFLVVSLLALSAGSCVSPTENELLDFAGEWCTLRSLGTDGLPVPERKYVGMTLFQQGTQLVGSGVTKRAGSTELWTSRYRGDVIERDAVIAVTDLFDDLPAPGPHFTLELRAEGVRDLVGMANGDDGFDGPITLVRLGPRCFAD